MKQKSLAEEIKKDRGLNRTVLHTLFFRLSGLLLIFLLQVMLARLMGPKHYGDYTVIITTINLLLVFSMFGFDSSVLRFLPSFIEKKNYAAANGFVKFSFRVISILAAACSICILIFLIIKSKSFNISFSEGLFWGILIIPFLALLYQACAVLRSMNRIKTSLMPVYFLFPLLMGVSCLYYFYTNNKLTVDAAMLINLGSTAVISIFINRKTKKLFKEHIPQDKTVYERRRWLSVSAILFLTTAFDLFLRQSDILMVSYFLGNTKAGYYAVATRLAMLASLGLSVADYVFMPKIAALFENKQQAKLQQLVQNSSLQILSITLPIVLILIIGGKWILGFFGPTFTISYVPLIILLCGQIFNSATGMVGGLMTMTGYQKIFFFFYFLAFIMQIILNLILIQVLDITGAAIGSSLSMIFLNICAYIFVKKKLKIKASFL